MELQKAFNHWKNDLVVPFVGGLETSENYLALAKSMEKRAAGSGCLFFVYAANKFFQESNKEKFMECLDLAAQSVSENGFEVGKDHLILLGQNQEQAWEIAIKERWDLELT